MPAGVPLRKYLTFMAASLFSMFIGSQVVHNYYHPLRDLNYYVEREIMAQHLREVPQSPENADTTKGG